MIPDHDERMCLRPKQSSVDSAHRKKSSFLCVIEIMLSCVLVCITSPLTFHKDHDVRLVSNYPELLFDVGLSDSVVVTFS